MPQRNVATNFTFEQQRQEINLVAQDHWSFYSSQTTANATFLKVDGSNGFTGANLSVPNAFTINANSGNGTVTISGNLDVTGTTTTVSSANLEVTDKNILIAKGSTSDAQADGAGITIDSATDITFNFVDAKDALVSSIGLEATTSLKSNTLTVAGLGSIGGGHFTGNFTPTTGSGVEVFAPDANTGQVSSFNRGTSTWNPLRIKGASVPIYTGTSNALVGTFNSTGLTMESGKTITGVLATAGQPNITSVGTLTGLTQTGQYNIGTFQNNDGINMGDSGYFQLRSDSRPSTGQAISIYSGGTTGGSLKAAIYHGGDALFQTLTLSAVSGTNTNAALPVLFQTAAGVIEGGSGLTYNPGGDTLSVNGSFIGSNTFRGAGSSAVLSCANSSSTHFVAISGTVVKIQGGTDHVLQFQDNIGEIGDVTGFQATNSAGTANTDFGIRANTIRFATGSSERCRVTDDGFMPNADNARDLGSSSLRWANIYSADLQLSNEGSANDVDGTWGQYTIQEGESDLFLINRRSGKKYKFNLTEVS